MYWLHLNKFHVELLILPAIKCVESSLIVVRKSARQRKKIENSYTSRVSSERFTQDYMRHMFHLYESVHVKRI